MYHRRGTRISARAFLLLMVGSWAGALDATRALRLGFVADESFDGIIRAHLEDEPAGAGSS